MEIFSVSFKIETRYLYGLGVGVLLIIAVCIFLLYQSTQMQNPQENELSLESLGFSTPDAVLVAGADGSANLPAERVHGQTAEEVADMYELIQIQYESHNELIAQVNKMQNSINEIKDEVAVVLSKLSEVAEVKAQSVQDDALESESTLPIDPKGLGVNQTPNKENSGAGKSVEIKSIWMLGGMARLMVYVWDDYTPSKKTPLVLIQGDRLGHWRIELVNFADQSVKVSHGHTQRVYQFSPNQRWLIQ